MKAKSGERIFRHIDIKGLMDGETTNSDAACVDKHIGSDVNDLELQLNRGMRKLPLRHTHGKQDGHHPAKPASASIR